MYDTWNNFDRNGQAASKILFGEFGKKGVMSDEFLLCYLWGHEEVEKSPVELDWHAKLCIQTLKGVERVLLLGKAAKYFVDQPDKVYGLWLENVTLLPGKRVMTAPSLREVSHQVVGEFRLAVNNFLS